MFSWLKARQCEDMILAVMNAILAKVAFLIARIMIFSLDFTSSVQYMIHFIYHFVH